jgi:hypothetical protein
MELYTIEELSRTCENCGQKLANLFKNRADMMQWIAWLNQPEKPAGQSGNRALRSFAAARFAQALVIYTRSQPIRQAARMARRHATWSAQVGPPFWVTLISNAYLPMRASVLASRPR